MLKVVSFEMAVYHEKHLENIACIILIILQDTFFMKKNRLKHLVPEYSVL